MKRNCVPLDLSEFAEESPGPALVLATRHEWHSRVRTGSTSSLCPVCTMTDGCSYAYLKEPGSPPSVTTPGSLFRWTRHEMLGTGIALWLVGEFTFLVKAGVGKIKEYTKKLWPRSGISCLKFSESPIPRFTERFSSDWPHTRSSAARPASWGPSAPVPLTTVLKTLPLSRRSAR